MIIRGKRDTNYTTMSNIGLDDDKLSFKAKGLLAYLLSKPDGWSVSDRHLATVGPDGRDAVQAALRELEGRGYLVRRRENGPGGKWVHHSYIYDEPQFARDAQVEATNTMAGNTSHGKTMDGKTMDGKTSHGKTVHGKTVHGKPRHIVSTEVVSTEVVSTEVDKSVKSKASQVAASTAHPPTTPAAKLVEEKQPTAQQEMFQALCDAVGWDPALLTVEQRGQVGQTMAALQKAGYSLDEVRRFHAEVWATDWRWTKNKSFPTLSQVRSEIAKVRRGGAGKGGNSGDDNRLSEEDVAAIRRQREERRQREQQQGQQREQQRRAADGGDVSALLGGGLGGAGRAEVGRALGQGGSMQMQAR